MVEMQCSKNEETYSTSPLHMAYNTYGIGQYIEWIQYVNTVSLKVLPVVVTEFYV